MDGLKPAGRMRTPDRPGRGKVRRACAVRRHVGGRRRRALMRARRGRAARLRSGNRRPSRRPRRDGPHRPPLRADCPEPRPCRAEPPCRQPQQQGPLLGRPSSRPRRMPSSRPRRMPSSRPCRNHSCSHSSILCSNIAGSSIHRRGNSPPNRLSSIPPHRLAQRLPQCLVPRERRSSPATRSGIRDASAQLCTAMSAAARLQRASSSGKAGPSSST